MTAPTGPDRTGVVARLDALEAAHKAATAGPWEVDGALGPVMGAAILPPCGTSEVPVIAVDAGVVRGADAAAIVAEHNLTPALLAAVRSVLEIADGQAQAAALPVLKGDRYDAGVAAAYRDSADRIRATVAAALGEA